MMIKKIISCHATTQPTPTFASLGPNINTEVFGGNLVTLKKEQENADRQKKRVQNWTPEKAKKWIDGIRKLSSGRWVGSQDPETDKLGPISQKILKSLVQHSRYSGKITISFTLGGNMREFVIPRIKPNLFNLSYFGKEVTINIPNYPSNLKIGEQQWISNLSNRMSDTIQAIFLLENYRIQNRKLKNKGRSQMLNERVKRRLRYIIDQLNLLDCMPKVNNYKLPFKVKIQILEPRRF